MSLAARMTRLARQGALARYAAEDVGGRDLSAQRILSLLLRAHMLPYLYRNMTSRNSRASYDPAYPGPPSAAYHPDKLTGHLMGSLLEQNEPADLYALLEHMGQEGIPLGRVPPQGLSTHAMPGHLGLNHDAGDATAGRLHTILTHIGRHLGVPQVEAAGGERYEDPWLHSIFGRRLSVPSPTGYELMAHLAGHSGPPMQRRDSIMSRLMGGLEDMRNGPGVQGLHTAAQRAQSGHPQHLMDLYDALERHFHAHNRLPALRGAEDVASLLHQHVLPHLFQ